MKSFRVLAVLFVSIVIIGACNKNNSTKVDYLIFGQFYGECYGEQCIEIFRLEDHRLLEDSKDNHPVSSDFYKGDFYEVSAEKFEKVNDLFNDFPDSLLNVNERIIG